MQTEREGVIKLFIVSAFSISINCQYLLLFVAIFNKISPYFCNIRLLALLLITDASCLMAIQKIVFFFRDGTLDVR